MILQRLLLKKLSKEELPHVVEKRCSVHRMRLSDCHKCVQTCPGQAIEIKRGQVAVSHESCQGCNICASVCPSEAFVPENFDYQTLLNKVVSEKFPTLGCYATDSPANIKIPCLFSLSDEILLAMMLKLAQQSKDISFHLAGCSQCSNFPKQLVFINNLSRARKFIQSVGLEIAIHGKFQPDFEKQPDNYSRREIFQVFRRDTANFLYESTKDILPKDSGNLPKSRQLLITQLNNIRQRTVTLTTPDILGNLRVEEHCNHCGICVKVCATNALMLKEQNQDGSKQPADQSSSAEQQPPTDHKLVHKPWRCLDCGTCRQACPRKAIKKTLFQGSVKQYFATKTLR